MSDITQEAVSEQQEEINYQELYEKAQEDLKKVLAKKEELLQETKKAKKEREEHASAAARAEQEKALKDGEYEKLWKSAEDQAKQFEERYNSLLNETKQEKIQTNAMKIAIELADGNAQSSKLLAKFVGESLGRMSDEKGSITDEVIAAVKKEFQANADFSPLLVGSKASGGGAPGNMNRVHDNSKTVDRSTFEGWNPVKKMEFVKGGGKLTDD